MSEIQDKKQNKYDLEIPYLLYLAEGTPTIQDISNDYEQLIEDYLAVERIHVIVLESLSHAAE